MAVPAVVPRVVQTNCIVIPSTAGGHMIYIEKAKDFEFYSNTSKGAMQGYGYEFHRSELISTP